MTNSRLVYLALAIIMIIGLGLARLFFAGPFYAFDDGNYIAYAHQMLNGTFTLAESPYTYGFFIPLAIALSFSILGVNVFASVLPTIIEYLMIIILAFEIAKKVYGDRVGLISAFLVATAPFVVGYSTRVLPDMAIGVMAGLSMLFFICAQEGRNSKLFYFLSGTFASLTIYVKLVGLAFIVFFVISMFLYEFIKLKQRTRAKMRYFFLYSLAGVIVFAFLYVVIFQVYGSGVLEALRTYGQNQNAISPTTLSKNVDSLFVALFGLFGYTSLNNPFAPFMDPQVFPLGLIVVFTACGTLIGFIKRDRSLIFLSVPLWGVFFYLFFGTVTLTGYSFMAVISRYFILVSIPIAVLASYSLCSISDFVSSRLRTRPIYIVLLFLSVIIISDIPIYNTLYNYNISISGAIRTFSGLLNYFATNSRGEGISMSISDNGYATNFLRFLLGYDNRGINVIPMNFSSKANITTWVSNECRPGTKNTYFVLVYSNYSELRYETVFQNWIVPYCNLTKVGTFQDGPSSNSVYDAMNVDIKQYKIG
jgi:4-amino-4-deoxy-L-arabinose transferase-like glycosyltransferase